MNDWTEATEWERKWWNTCQNTLREELLQIEYAKRMGLVFTPTDRTPYEIDMGGKSVLDIGGGPCSLLLKCVNVYGMVADPCEFPAWVKYRYECAKIQHFFFEGETADLWASPFHEVWIYNVLQHTKDPAKIIANARRAAKVIRIFEWIDTTVSPGHPHVLTQAELSKWLGFGHIMGTVEEFREHGSVGKAFYGAFQQ